MKLSRATIIVAATCAFVILGTFHFYRQSKVIATIDVLDIGQGDAILVSSGRTQLLIDAGPDRSILSELGRTMPMFDRTIELAVLSHPHADHLDGFIPTLERYRIERLISSGDVATTSQFERLVRMLAEAKTEQVIVGKGDVIDFPGGIKFDVLWPVAGWESDDPNERSVMLRMNSPDHDERAVALFTGDATARIEGELVKSGDDLGAELLKVGHHGSKYSSTAPFLRAVAPRFAAISLSSKNKFGHPGWSTLARLTAVRTAVARTDQVGGIRYVLRRTKNGIILEQKRDFLYTLLNKE